MTTFSLYPFMFSVIVPWVGVFAFLRVESSLRQGKEAKSLVAGEQDKNSTRYLGIAIGVSLLTLLFSPALNFFHVTYIGSWYLLLGGMLSMALGLAIRIQAARSLGRFYTRTLTTLSDHHLHTTGIYRHIRNPGYLGSMLLFGGAGMAANNWISLSICVLLPLVAYIFRINAEESMLQQLFGEEYTLYREKSWRLIPFIY